MKEKIKLFYLFLFFGRYRQQNVKNKVFLVCYPQHVWMRLDVLIFQSFSASDVYIDVLHHMNQNNKKKKEKKRFFSRE